MKQFVIAAAMAAALIASPATAYADPVPTADEVVAIMADLTDPGIPAANKGNIVSPGFSPDEAGTIDDHMQKMSASGVLPLNFVVTDIQPAPGNLAGATVACTGSYHQTTPPGPVVLVNQGGRWLITHDTAWTAMDAFWNNANRRHPHGYVP
jgi:hypothetical protein